MTNLSTESGNLFKMAAKIKSERVWVRGLETGENKQNGGKGANSYGSDGRLNKEAKSKKECM